VIDPKREKQGERESASIDQCYGVNRVASEISDHTQVFVKFIAHLRFAKTVALISFEKLQKRRFSCSNGILSHLSNYRSNFENNVDTHSTPPMACQLAAVWVL
jgi:hypothetical protein